MNSLNNVKLFQFLNYPDLESAQQDLFSDKNFLLLNPRIDISKQSDILAKLQYFKIENDDPFFLIPTSGTTSFNIKLVLLTKKSLLSSAYSINNFFSLNEKQKWLLSLPLNHVGGLSILARSHLLNQKVDSYLDTWNPKQFYSCLMEKKINLVSLVPTQLYDLLKLEATGPSSLEKIFIGGGFLSLDLYNKAKYLGWKNIVLTYGMTETGSMIAYCDEQDIEKRIFKPLPHAKFYIGMNNYLEIQSTSLFSGYLIDDGLQFQFYPIDFSQSDYKKTSDLRNCDNSKNSAYWKSEDKVIGEIHGFQLVGRDSHLLKIKGEIVNIQSLQNLMEKILTEKKLHHQSFFIYRLANERKENELFVFVDKNHFVNPKQTSNLGPDSLYFSNLVMTTLQEYNKNVLPHERIFNYFLIDQLPKTELGKVKLSDFERPQFKETFYEKRKNILE